MHKHNLRNRVAAILGTVATLGAFWLAAGAPIYQT